MINETIIKSKLLKAGDLYELCKSGRIEESFSEVVTKLDDGSEFTVNKK